MGLLLLQRQPVWLRGFSAIAFILPCRALAVSLKGPSDNLTIKKIHYNSTLVGRIESRSDGLLGMQQPRAGMCRSSATVSSPDEEKKTGWVGWEPAWGLLSGPP